jgi:hypothetical protein
MSQCLPYCNCDACRVRRLEMRELQLLDEMKALENQLDEAREVAQGLLAHLEAVWEVVGDQTQLIAATIAGQQKEVTHAVKRFYPWLKEKQADVDIEEENPASYY